LQDVSVLAMSEPTTLFLLMEAKLGEPLAEFIAARRPGTAWRLIAIELTRRTGIDVTYETVRGWSLAAGQRGEQPVSGAA
jgi:hypothetical protein